MYKPVLIPTDKSNLAIVKKDYKEHEHLGGLFHPENQLEIVFKDYVDLKFYTCYNIILIDTEAEIVEGDLHYGTSSDPEGVVRGSICNYDSTKHCMSSDGGKIISSTNKSHNLPQLLPQSIQLLISYYNKFKCMPESVEVEFEEVKHLKGVVEIISIEPFTNLQGEVDITIPEVKGYITITNVDCIRAAKKYAGFKDSINPNDADERYY